MPPPGEFSQPDIYCRKWWRRMQYLSNKCWSQWHKEFLLSLQERQKWSSTRRRHFQEQFQQEDIVILKGDNCRWNEWKLVKVIKTFPDKKGLVWTVKLLISSINKNGSMDNWALVWPVDKVVLLVETDKVEWWGSIPDEGAMKQEVKIYHDYLQRSQLYMDLAAVLVAILKYWTESCWVFLLFEKLEDIFTFYCSLLACLQFLANYYIKMACRVKNYTTWTTKNTTSSHYFSKKLKTILCRVIKGT